MNIPDEVKKRNEDAMQQLRDMGLSQEEIYQYLGIVTESYTDKPTAAQKMQLYDAAQAKINEEDKEKNRLFKPFVKIHITQIRLIHLAILIIGYKN